jgi:hypothetical protein
MKRLFSPTCASLPFRASIAAILAALSVAACASFEEPLPPVYVPDEDLISLKQDAGFIPIDYESEEALPYDWNVAVDRVDAEKPSFLKLSNLAAWRSANRVSDARYLAEVPAFLALRFAQGEFAELRALLSGDRPELPPALPPETGDVRKEFTNGVEYAYPGADGATIFVKPDGYYSIKFADGSTFTRWSSDGSYAMKDARGVLLYAVWPETGGAEILVEGLRWRTSARGASIEAPAGTATYFEDPVPQVKWEPARAKEACYFLMRGRAFDSIDDFRQAQYEYKGINVCWDYDSKSLLVSSGGFAVNLMDADGPVKTYYPFDRASSSSGTIIDIRFQNGTRLVDIDSGKTTHVEGVPEWPEAFKSRKVGPFTFLYVEKDEGLVKALDSAKLAALEASCRELSGLGAFPVRTVVIPPDLHSYRRMHATSGPERLEWLPAGFQGSDAIYLWPLSVPRYRDEEGQRHFLEVEAYEILAHEYVHLLVSQASGIVRPLPIWLTEGLAVYVESALSDATREYWDAVVRVAVRRGSFLPWDAIAANPTSAYPIRQARVHYAQSYAMARHLMQAYGAAKVASYVASFKVPFDRILDVDLAESYKANFQLVFGIDWETGLDAALASLSAP